MDLNEVFKEKKLEDLKALLPEFRGCKNYAERLAFWDRHNLHIQVTYIFDEEVRSSGKLFIELHIFNTWQELANSETLSLVPFTDAEKETFIDWGISRRKATYPRLQEYYDKKFREWTAENDIQPIQFDTKDKNGQRLSGVQMLYREELFRIQNETKYHRQFHGTVWPQNIPARIQDIENKIDGFSLSFARSLDREYLLNNEWDRVIKTETFTHCDKAYSLVHRQIHSINPTLYNSLVAAFKIGEDTRKIMIENPFWHHNTWVEIDTYIRAETDCLFRSWLADRKREYEKTGGLTFSGSAKLHGDNRVIEGNEIGNISNESPRTNLALSKLSIRLGTVGLTERENVLVHCYRGEPAIENGQPGYADYLKYYQTSNRIRYPDESPRKAKSLIKSIQKTFPYLTETQKETAENEISTINANFSDQL